MLSIWPGVQSTGVRFPGNVRMLIGKEYSKGQAINDMSQQTETQSGECELE